MAMPSCRKVRTVFVSDIHLGTRHCQAELVADFLDAHEAETIYLIGDIIDGWRLKRSWYWPQTHEAVIQRLLKSASRGTTVYFVPGNHDEFARVYAGRMVAKVAVRDHVVHQTADGRQYLVTHGDQYDPVMQRAKWLAHLGDWFYELALTSNTVVNWGRRRLGLGYWSLGAFAKRHVKTFIGIIGQFETVVAEDVRRRGLHGVICGHIHHAVGREMGGIHYLNAGDWVESCTAIIEHLDGRLEVVRWTEGARQAAPTGAIVNTPVGAPGPSPGGPVL
ncbi:MAG: UDP-2,3-diacylglucosamine diphosphatase [Alphaproteobacteria bacterium]|nr:UDP-2,3-diacylglucosamine diphosphatase [Alphaproteobacteria bacterium]